MNKFFLNPFRMYILGFLIVFILYNFNWSYVQYAINDKAVFFLFSTFFIAFFFSLIIDNVRYNFSNKLDGVCNKYLVMLIILAMLSNFIYQGYIPFIYTLKGIYYDYFKFGIPSFQAMFVPYLTVFGSIAFFNFIKTKQKYLLFCSLLPLFYSILIMMRGNIVLIFLIYTFIYIGLARKITLKKILALTFVSLLLMYIFGLVGNARMISSGYTTNDAILRVGQATPEFYNNWVPTEFFWSYIYITTPFSNFLYQSDTLVNNLNLYDSFKYHIMIDWLQKRIVDTEFESRLIQDELNVSTMYGDVIQTSGFYGAYIVFFWYCFVVCISMFLCSKHYRLIMLSFFCAISVMLCFSNILQYSAYGMLPFYLVLISRFKIGKLKLA